MSAGASTIDKQRFYDSIADSFDDIMNEYDVGRRLTVVFNEFLRQTSLEGKKLLDAGCGTGRFSEWAVRRGAAVTSLDIGSALLRRVRERCQSTPACGDVLHLPFQDAAFDIVLSSECIEHTTDPRRAVTELVRVCRPGGLIVLTCPNKIWRWSCTLANALGIRPYKGIENWPGWFELRRWLKTSGARRERSTGIHLFPFVLGFTQPLLRRLDALGKLLGPLYVNQAVLAVRTPA